MRLAFARYRRQYGRMALPEILCAFEPCGRTFTPRRRTQRFHHPDCKNAYHRGHYQTGPHRCPLCRTMHEPEQSSLSDALEHLALDARRLGYGRDLLLHELEALLARRREMVPALDETRPSVLI